MLAPTRRRSLRVLAGTALALAAAMASPVVAQESARDAVALIDAYIKAHNAHEPEETLSFYHQDAQFHLSMGRGVVEGIDDIARLEYFDAAAGSTLYPQQVTARREGEMWIVSLGYVIEYSDVFAAMGLKIVLAEGLDYAFVLEGGKIRSIVQPELKPACMQAMGTGFALLVDWLKDSDDPRRDVLLRDGSLYLTGDTAPILIQAVNDWRDASGWGPTREQAFECAQVDADR
ncbi:MAG: hypothetical protein JJU27_15490 [Gammaproteobacteria bacterium]|nr:hypothetical protein [Gammaproteobacteria bacterium]